MAEKPLETRTVETKLEVRSGPGDPVIEGYASVFNQPYDMGPFREIVLPGAFTRTLSASPDVRLLIDHDGQPLARTKSGTLQLSEDATGLHVRATLDPSDPDVQRLLPKMKRGDLDQMSFAFRVPSGGDSWSEDYTMRSMRELILADGDVSVVTYPASSTTSVSLRSKDLLEARCVFMVAMAHEMRAGKALSAANMAKLQSVLDSIASADVALDAAQQDLADVIGVPNPDEPEPPAPARTGRPALLVAALARSLDLAH